MTTVLRPPENTILPEPSVDFAQSRPDTATEFALLDPLLVVLTHHVMIVKSALACALLATIVAFLIPVKYTATAKLLPPRDNQSITSMVLGSQLGSIGSLVSGSRLKDPNDTYVGILKSRTVADTIIRRFDLMRVYRKKTMADAAQVLKKSSYIGAGLDSIITIEVEDRDPGRSAAIANAYVNELARLTTAFVNSNARQRRVFLESQLSGVHSDLGRAEGELRSTQERTGLITVSDQAKTIIESVAKMGAQVAATEVTLQSMRSYATAYNPDVIRLETELKTMRAQLARMERSGQLGQGSIQVPTGKVPSVSVEYADRLRQVKYFEVLMELISKQYELARLDEASSISTVDVLDVASPPEKRSKPKRGLIVFLGIVVGVFIGVTGAFIRDYLDRVAARPEGLERLQRLKSVFPDRSRLRWRHIRSSYESK